MAVKMSDELAGVLGSLRYEPTAKRIRATLGGRPVPDTCAARLVWEPRRVVPTYAVPRAAVAAELVASPDTGDDDGVDRPVLDPSVPFAAHSCEGDALDVVAGETTAVAAAFGPYDGDLADYLLLDFAAFDWREESETIVSHPHDPFHRIDVLRSDRHIRIERDGRLLAESSRAMLLFETLLPVRYYLPREDVAAELVDSDTVTYCAYKGRAAYFSVAAGPKDLAWTYREPLHDAEPVRGRVCFFNERVDVTVDGERGVRPLTPWSEA